MLHTLFSLYLMRLSVGQRSHIFLPLIFGDKIGLTVEATFGGDLRDGEIGRKKKHFTVHYPNHIKIILKTFSRDLFKTS